MADRVTVVTYFVDIIKVCCFKLYLIYANINSLQHSVSINNFNAAAALIGGLSHSSISRLRPTWEVHSLLLSLLQVLTFNTESTSEGHARLYTDYNLIRNEQKLQELS